jgi:hypothetical protein
VLFVGLDMGEGFGTRQSGKQVCFLLGSGIPKAWELGWSHVRFGAGACFSRAKPLTGTEDCDVSFLVYF